MQLHSSLTPQRLAHPLARVPHLKCGHVGIALGCRHPRMAKYLLDDTDVHALLDQQCRGRMPGVMDPGIPNPGLPENRLPGPPVLGTFDRTAMPRGEDQIMILPGVSCPQPLSCLPLAVLLEQIQDRGRALEREFALALALALPKDDASTNALRAFVGMSNAIRPTRTLVAGVTIPRAVWFTSLKVLMLLAALLAGSPVPLLAARVRVVAAVPPGGALDLEPCLYYAGIKAAPAAPLARRQRRALPWRPARRTLGRMLAGVADEVGLQRDAGRYSTRAAFLSAPSRKDRPATLVQPEPIRMAATRAANAVGW